MSLSYSTLQSGFIAPVNKNLIKSVDPSDEEKNVALRLGKSIPKDPFPFFYHDNIQKAFTEYENNRRVIEDFDFRENFIRFFIDAVGFNSFKLWLTNQRKSQFITLNHIMFLEDSMNYIMYGDRKISLMTWLDILDTSKNTLNDTKTIKEVSDFFTTLNKKETHNGTTDFHNILSDWLSHRDGFNDFIYFSKIVFGEVGKRKRNS